jgi:hypothetical protein
VLLAKVSGLTRRRISAYQAKENLPPRTRTQNVGQTQKSQSLLDVMVEWMQRRAVQQIQLASLSQPDSTQFPSM